MRVFWEGGGFAFSKASAYIKIKKEGRKRGRRGNGGMGEGNEPWAMSWIHVSFLRASSWSAAGTEEAAETGQETTVVRRSIAASHLQISHIIIKKVRRERHLLLEHSIHQPASVKVKHGVRVVEV